MEDTAIPYELPEVENHSFFFIDQRVTTKVKRQICERGFISKYE